MERKLAARAVSRRWDLLLTGVLALFLVGCLLFCTIPAVTGAEPPKAEQNDEAGFEPIFNGKDLTGWEGKKEFWSVRDGAITGQTTPENPTRGNTFLIWKDGEVDDFELRLSYRIDAGNSGIQYRSKHHGDFVVGGYQADIDSGDTYSGILYEERGRGILAGRGEKVVMDAEGKKQSERFADSKELQSKIKKLDWNEYTIIARGNHIIHKINGHVTAEFIDNQADKRSMAGILALQLHAGPPMVVQFKNLRLKRTKLADGRKKVVMIAGTPSHGPGHHEFNAGVLLLKKCLQAVPNILPVAYLNGWPKDPTAFDNADSILLYMDGGGGHPLIREDRLLRFSRLMQNGVGLACVHYAVEIPKDRGGPELLEWIGGFYERDYSINPHWTATFESLPEHPITRGVRPFTLNDEWYFNMRFPLDAGAVQAILRATPPDDKRGTPAAKEFPGRSEVLAWAIERADGGRGFGFTGGHFHRNWGDENFRRIVLNALLWTAKAEVPAEGVSSTLGENELAQNLDPKGERK